MVCGWWAVVVGGDGDAPRVEADAELANEVHVVRAAAPQGLHELLGARLGDAAQVVHQLVCPPKRQDGDAGTFEGGDEEQTGEARARMGGGASANGSTGTDLLRAVGGAQK